MRRRIPEHFPPRTKHPAIPRNPPFARPLLHAFSLMYSQIFVSNSTLSFSRQPRPPSQARLVCFSHVRATSHASMRTVATGALLFSTLCRGAEFISRPNALVSHERHRVRLLRLSLPYSSKLIPSVVLQPLRRWKRVFFFFSISILRSRSVTSGSVPIRRDDADPVAEIHRRRYIQRSQMDFTYVRRETLLKFVKGEKTKRR